jgi:hypothetical protein
MSEADQFWMQKYQKIYNGGGLTKAERAEIRERYLAEQMRSETIKMNKRTVIGKEDMLNLPRHKVVHQCSAFQECPLCYKCRNYDSSHMACRQCILAQEKLLCNTQLHTEQVLNMMVKRERIDLDGTRFRVFYRQLENGSGFIQKIVLPGGEVVLFDDEKGMIDFEKMRPYIGQEFEYLINEKSQGKRKLKDIGRTEEGIQCIYMEDL